MLACSDVSATKSLAAALAVVLHRQTSRRRAKKSIHSHDSRRQNVSTRTKVGILVRSVRV